MLEIWISGEKPVVFKTRICPRSVPVPSGFISETGEYIIEIRGKNATDFDLTIDDIPLLALRATTTGAARWLWTPGFYAGSVELRVSCKEKTIWTDQVILDPDIAKLTRDEFDQMVRDILSDTFALFAISSTRKGVSRGPGGMPPPIARLEFLRSRLKEIDKAVREIDRFPVRILTSKNTRISSGKSVPISSSDLARSYHTEQLQKIPASSPLAARFGKFFPRKLQLTKRRVNLDIGEHRAIKAELKTWCAWLNVVAHNLEVIVPKDEDSRAANLRKCWAVRCRAMARDIQQLLILPVFDGVSDGNQPMTLTSVFQWAAPYRKFFRITSDFRAGIAKVSGDFLNIPVSRTFELYELWVFLRLVKIGIQVFGGRNIDLSSLFTTSSPGSIRISSSAVFVKLTPSLTLCFKRAYEEYWLARPVGSVGSFSRTMIPDISVASDDMSGKEDHLIVLDAKYRVKQQLNDAIGSLHTYRDAIVQSVNVGDGPHRVVKGSYLITPDLSDLTEAEAGTSWQKHKLPGLLFHPAYKREFKFGAISFRPGMEDAQLITAFKAILADAGVQYSPQ